MSPVYSVIRTARPLPTPPTIRSVCSTLNARSKRTRPRPAVAAAALLADLRLTGCSRVGDAAMEHVGRLQSLTHLHLNGTTVSDAGMSHRSRPAHLEWLNVEGSLLFLYGRDSLHQMKNSIARGARL